jgi:hypothetical protein
LLRDGQFSGEIRFASVKEKELRLKGNADIQSASIATHLQMIGLPHWGQQTGRLFL